MRILAIETSCDETSAAVVEKNKSEKNVRVISNIISSSVKLHSQTGGIIPEIAAREQNKYIIPVIIAALGGNKDEMKKIDAIAVTYGPGLIGSLLIGVETAKTLSFIYNLPLIPVNHLFGHIYANWIDTNDKKDILFPAISLIVSGGHTDLVLINEHNKIKWLGGTRDDAAGEAFDKSGRLLDIAYPAGPTIEKLAINGDPKKFPLPSPMIDSSDLDFSFSGLKAAVVRQVEKLGTISEKDKEDLSSSLQNAVFNVLLKKTKKAIEDYNAKSFLLGGGVAANSTLRERLTKELTGINIYIPEKEYCTDNAAMIGANAFFVDKKTTWENLDANPELYFD